MMMMMVVMMMMINDDDNDNVVEGTCTGPHAVRSDVKHQVSHSAKIFIFLPRFQLIRRRRADRRWQNEVLARTCTCIY